MRRRWLPLVLLVLTAALVVSAPGASAATATTSVPDVADALRRDPVFIDPGAERALTDDEADEVRNAITDSGQAVFVAVLPASMAPTAADAEQLVREIVEASGLSGTYAVIVGDRFRATSTAVANADEIAVAAFQSERGAGAVAVLTEFVDRLESEGTVGSGEGGGGVVGERQPDEGSEGSDGSGSAVPLVLLAAGGGGLWLWSRRRRNQQRTADEAAMASDRQMMRAELAVLADDVMRLEAPVALHPEARTDYEAAVERYRIAEAALDYADEPIDLVRVQRVLDEARYAMSRARAITDGREPPPPPDELRRPGRHDEPALDLDERGAPYYVGGGPFYGGGWFGGGGGLFSGLLLGSMLGGWGGMGWGSHVEVNNYGTDGGGGWGGGWSDSGVGGGDWGGGDWGGGDLGGGDW